LAVKLQLSNWLQRLQWQPAVPSAGGIKKMQWYCPGTVSVSWCHVTTSMCAIPNVILTSIVTMYLRFSTT
jgi:hypothetical protein